MAKQINDMTDLHVDIHILKKKLKIKKNYFLKYFYNIKTNSTEHIELGSGSDIFINSVTNKRQH